MGFVHRMAKRENVQPFACLAGQFSTQGQVLRRIIWHKLDPVTQSRISALLDKNNQGTITKRERSELERLVEKAEKIGLHNARALVEYRGQRAENSRRRSRKESEVTVLA
jgi:hypothetical protein